MSFDCVIQSDLTFVERFRSPGRRSITPDFSLLEVDQEVEKGFALGSPVNEPINGDLKKFLVRLSASSILG
jgi:hypothetical protein